MERLIEIINSKNEEPSPRSAWSKLAKAARTAIGDIEELSPGPARTAAEAKAVAIFDFCTLGLGTLAIAPTQAEEEEPIPGPTIALEGGDERGGKKWPRWSLPASPFPVFFQKDVVITRAINARLGIMGLQSLRGVSQGCLAYVDDSQDLLRFASAKYGLGLKEMRLQKLEVAGSVAFGTDVRDKSFIDTSSGYLQLLGPQLQHSDLKELSLKVSWLEGNVKGGPNFITLTISTGVPLYHLFERIPDTPSQEDVKWTTLAKGDEGVVEEIQSRVISTGSRVNGRSIAAVFSPHQDDKTSHVAALFSNDSMHLFRNTLHETIALPAGKRPSVLRLFNYDLEGASLALVAVHSEYLSIWRIEMATLSSMPLYNKDDSAAGDWRFCASFSPPSEAGCYVNPRLLNQGLKVALDSGDYLVYHMTENNIRFLKIPARVKTTANGNAESDFPST